MPANAVAAFEAAVDELAARVPPWSLDDVELARRVLPGLPFIVGGGAP